MPDAIAIVDFGTLFVICVFLKVYQMKARKFAKYVPREITESPVKPQQIKRIKKIEIGYSNPIADLKDF